MPSVLSKQGKHIGNNKILAEIKYIDELEGALLDIETCDDPDALNNVQILFAAYIIGEAIKISGHSQWTCCYSYNQELGTSWPTDTFAETQDLSIDSTTVCGTPLSGATQNVFLMTCTGGCSDTSTTSAT